nr:MAG TPA: hypothetical protein [Caudoviricetes sp.]
MGTVRHRHPHRRRRGRYPRLRRIQGAPRPTAPTSASHLVEHLHRLGRGDRRPRRGLPPTRVASTRRPLAAGS